MKQKTLQEANDEWNKLTPIQQKRKVKKTLLMLNNIEREVLRIISNIIHKNIIL